MGVYIKDMEMPIDCGLCPFEDYGHCCVIYGRIRAESGRDTACPLVEIPTPHGRLIDADELKDFISRWGQGLDAEDCERLIEQSDTVIEADDADLEVFDE